jgi:hypothetical protein
MSPITKIILANPNQKPPHLGVSKTQSSRWQKLADDRTALNLHSTSLGR